MFCGPVSNAVSGSSNPFNQVIPVLVGSAILISVVVQAVRSTRRNRGLREMVKRRQLQWLGSALPHYVPGEKLLAHEPGAPGAMSISNAFMGTIGQREFVSCDCQRRQGRYLFRRSLIAARCNENPFTVTHWDSSYHTAEEEGWFAIFPDRAHLLPQSVIEALIDNIR
jgi:hypothetical protein